MREESLAAKLAQLKEKEAAYRQKIERLRGQEDQLRAQLKSQFGISGLQEAKEKLEVMNKDIRSRYDRLVTMVEDLEEALQDVRP